jgi:hypothetical protein
VTSIDEIIRFYTCCFSDFHPEGLIPTLIYFISQRPESPYVFTQEKVLGRVHGMDSANKPTQRGESAIYFFAMLGGEVVMPRGCILAATAT